MFTGGVMYDGARLTNWYDTEWDYGFAKGIDVLLGSVDLLLKQHVDLALRVADRAYVLSHGSIALTGTAAALQNDTTLLHESYFGADDPERTLA